MGQLFTMACKLQILSLLVLIGIIGAEARYKCPDYDAIRTPGVAAGNFSLADFTGSWYMMATNEPTMPAFCKCTTEEWFLDSATFPQQYRYNLKSTCEVPVSLTMKGDAPDPTRPGDLHENAAVYNHSMCRPCLRPHAADRCGCWQCALRPAPNI